MPTKEERKKRNIPLQFYQTNLENSLQKRLVRSLLSSNVMAPPME
jgi:hypothetical protein